MHIGEAGKPSKTEAIIFVAPGRSYESYDTSCVPVASGYITYTRTFKYLGCLLNWDLNNCPDLKNHALQAQKALSAMMPK
eukprot:3831791-Ditylum_brightwellii.AAC.1